VQRRLQRRIADWERESTTTLGSLTSGEVNVTVNNVGNPLASDWDPTARNLDAAVTADTIGIADYASTPDGRRGMTVDSAEMTGLSLEGTNVLSERNRQIGVHLDSVEAAGYRDRDGGTWARQVNATGVDATVEGQTVGATIEDARVRGAGSGGNSIGYARLRHTQANITNLGEADQATSASFRGVYASGVRSRSEGMDVRLAQLRGSRGSFSMGPGGRMSAGLANFSGNGLDITRTSEAGETSQLGVETFEGTGASYSSSSRGMSVNVGTLTGETVTASGAMTGGRQVEIGEVRVNGLAASQQTDGEFSLDMQSAEATNIHSTDDRGILSTVEAARVTDVHASGSMTDVASILTEGRVGELEVINARIDEDGRRVDLDFAIVQDISADNLDFTDTSNITGDIAVRQAEMSGFSASMRGEDGGWSDYSADQADAAGIRLGMRDGGRMHGSLESATVLGGSLRQDLTDACDAPRIGERVASADQLDVSGVRFASNGSDRMVAQADQASGENVAFADTMEDGTASQSGGAERFQLDDVTALMDGDRMGVSYGAASLTEAHYTRGREGTDEFVDFASDYVRAGGEDAPVSYVMLDADGRVSGNLHALRLGPNTDANGLVQATARWGSDPDNHLTATIWKTGSLSGDKPVPSKWKKSG
jgi:hypothetical protein